MERCDVLVLGAGAAGLFAAAEAGRRGRRVLVIEHAKVPGEKIRISGGGRCNFTNRDLNRGNARDRFLSENSRFALSALSRFTPADFVARVDRAGIAWHEKTLGQLFCDGKATQIIQMLTDDLRETGGALRLETGVETVARAGTGFVTHTTAGPIGSETVIVATGGKSIPKMGASGVAYRIAEAFGLRVTETRPALVPLTFAEQDLALTAPMAGVSMAASVRHGRTAFNEALLFTHRGLSGPAILQISSYWREGDAITIDLMAGRDIGAELAAMRSEGGRIALHNAVARLMPDKLAAFVVQQAGLSGRLADQGNRALGQLAAQVHDWRIRPVSSEGYRTAEVTLGGIATSDLDSRTMQASGHPGLFFVGEAVDVTGWLGGYNFQWAWSSGWAAGQVA